MLVPQQDKTFTFAFLSLIFLYLLFFCAAPSATEARMQASPSPVSEGHPLDGLKWINLAGITQGSSTGDNYQYLEETSEVLSFQQARRSPGWKLAEPLTEARGLLPYAIWMRFVLHNSTNEDMQLMLEYRDPASSSLDLYHRLLGDDINLGNKFSHMRTTYNGSVFDRPVPFLRPVFPINIAAGEAQEIYVRAFAGDDFPNQVYTSLRIWERNAFDRSSHIELTLVAAVVTLQLLMALATFIAFIMTRERLFFFYSLFSLTGASTLTSNSGHLWYFVVIDGYEQWMTLLQVCIFQVAAFSFVRSFMKIERFSVVLDRMLVAVIWVEITSVFCTLIGLREIARLIADLTVIPYLLLIPLGLYAWKKGVVYAGLFTVSWFVFIVGTLTFALTNNGYIQNLPLGHETIYYGFFIEFFLLATIMSLRLRDISQEKRSLEVAKAEKERENVRAQEKVIQAQESSLRLKNDFITSVSHELRTPMNAIVGGLQVAQQQLPDHMKSSLDMVQGGASEMMVLVSDILTHAEIQFNQLSVQSRNTSLLPLFMSLHKNYQEKCDAKALDLQWNIEPSLPPWVMVDDEKLIIILTKLLDNALKFTEQGAVIFAVECDIHSAPIELRCIVEDTGIGISPQKSADIFNAFTQSDSGFQRRYSGLGIGLSISKQLVEIIGGQIELTSITGQGSSFVVTIPLQSGSTPDKVATSRRASAELPILVVEDNVVNQKVLQNMLKKLGYRTQIAHHGEEAFELLDKEPFSLILMDLQMPVMDGFTCAEKIRCRKDRCKDIPIIAVTANLMGANKQRCIESGMDDFLQKPINLSTLQQSLEKFIESGSVIAD